MSEALTWMGVSIPYKDVRLKNLSEDSPAGEAKLRASFTLDQASMPLLRKLSDLLVGNVEGPLHVPSVGEITAKLVRVSADVVVFHEVP